MKNVTCTLHGLTLRPDRCTECAQVARLGVDLRVLKVEQEDRGRFLLLGGKLSLIGAPVDTSKVPLFWD